MVEPPDAEAWIRPNKTERPDKFLKILDLRDPYWRKKVEALEKLIEKRYSKYWLRADETRYLAPLEEIAERGETAAEELLRKYRGPWGGVVDRVYEEYAY